MRFEKIESVFGTSSYTLIYMCSNYLSIIWIEDTVVKFYILFTSKDLKFIVSHLAFLKAYVSIEMLF